MLHRADELAVAKSMITGELDLADLDLWTFFDFENENDRVARSDALILRSDLCKLPAVLSKQFLDNHFRLLDFSGVELAFDGKTDFAFLEAIENVGLGNGMNVVVTDAANDRPLFDVKYDHLVVRTLRRVLHAQLHILEKLGVPECLKIAA